MKVLSIIEARSYFLGGYFKARLTFPKDYPMKPPKLTFISKMWHPNVHSNGDVCISILHEPGDDKYGYEKASERWLPIHTVEVKQPFFRTNRVFFKTILISVISMLADPNDESPANIDAAKMWRESKKEFVKRVAQTVRRSQEEL